MSRALHAVANTARRALDRLGYDLTRRKFQRFGVNPFTDIQRLAQMQTRQIRTIFDVGANIGQTAEAASAAFPNASVYSFEPHPKTFAQLSARQLPRVHPQKLALSEVAGPAVLFEYGDEGEGSLCNSLAADTAFATEFGYQAASVPVTCTTLDAFCADNDIGHIDLLKIDVEGLELSVLKGAAGLLQAGRVSYVYTEFNEISVRDGVTGGALAPISGLLAAQGLRFVATYTDFVWPERGMFVVANALFAKP